MFENIFINLRASTSGMGSWYNNTRKLNQTLTNINKDANRTANGIARMGGSFKGLNQVIGIGKLMLIGRVFENAIQSAMDMTETVNLFSVAMGDMATKTDETVQKMSRLYGLDATNLQNSVGTFSLLARSMGMSTQQSSVLSTNMAKLAVDLASLTNVPIAQVMADLKSGLVGQSETVYKYGMDVTEAGIKAEAMRQGITKSVREMSQGEKMALRYSAMIRQSGLAQGDFANTINTPANQLKILGERFVTLGRAVGGIFLPILGATLPYLNALVMLLTELAMKLALLVGFEPPKVTDGVRSALGGLGDDADYATGNIGKTEKALKKLKGVTSGFDELNIMPDPNKGGAGIGGGNSILPTFDFTGYDNMMDKVKSKADEILVKFKEFGDVIRNLPIEPLAFILGTLVAIILLGSLESITLGIIALGGAFYGLREVPVIGEMFVKLTNVMQKVLTGVEALTTAISGLGTIGIIAIVASIAVFVASIITLWKTNEDFRNSWIEVWNRIKDFFASIWNNILKPIFDAIVKTLLFVWENGLKPLWKAWLDVFKSISDIVSGAISFILPVMSALVEFIGSILVPIVKILLTVFAMVFNGICGMLTGALTTIGDIINDIKLVFKGLINFITGVLTGDWTKAINGLVDIFKGIFSGIYNIVKSVMNQVIDAINGAFRGFGDIRIPDFVPIVGGKSFSIPKIPRLARGGMLTDGSLFEAGEGGKAEMIGSHNGRTTVMPLENTDFVSAMYDAVYDAVSTAMGQGSGGSEIVLKVGSTEFGRVAIDSINKITKQEGRLALNI